jgi:cytochrome c oxidase subunit I+III
MGLGKQSAIRKSPPVETAVVSGEGFSHHPPRWWGNRFVMLLEGAGLAVLAFTYFYVWRNFETWPPTGVLVPDIGISTLNVAVLVTSILPMWHVARLALRHEKPRTIGIWLLGCTLFGMAATVLRVMEFKTVHTRWDNPYGAIVWSILIVHLAHILASTLETLNLGILTLRGPVVEKHFVDIGVNAVYWYFVALSWVALYAIVFVAPRFM